MNGTRPALFRHRYLVYATLVFSALVLMLLLIVSGQRGVLHPVVIGSAVALISSFYVTMEFLRARFRFSIRAILVAMFGIGLACALWGQTFLLVSRQRAAVNRVRIIGGSATQRTYDGHWAVTGAGWVLPAPLANRLGVDLTEQLSAVLLRPEFFDPVWFTLCDSIRRGVADTGA